MYYILATTVFLLSILEGTLKYSRIKKFFFIVTAVLFIIIQSFNSWSPDLSSYLLHFELIDVDYVRMSSEPFHIFLIETVQRFKGDFKTFILIYGLLIFIPFLYFLKKTSPLPVFVLSLFFFIPFFPDIAQLRSFLSVSIFAFSLLYFEKNKIVFYSLLVFAILCHYSIVIMFAFIVVRKAKFFNKQTRSNVIILTGVLLLNFIPRDISDPFISAINPKYGSYLQGTSTYLGTLALFAPFFILNNFVIYHYNRYFPSLKHKIHDKYKQYIPTFIQLIQFANYLVLLQYFIRDFSRLTMNLTVLSYIYVSIILYYGWSKNYNRFTLLLVRYGVFVWVILTFFMVFLALNDGEYMKVIEKTFSSNRVYGESN